MITELFAGPGGLGAAAATLGLHGQGIEWDANAVATRRAAGLPTIHADVRRHGPADFPGAYILAAGPPCQTFTIAGSGVGRAVLAEVLRAEGYEVATGVLRTEQYGLPQTRRRAVVVARLGAPAALPAPTHRAYRKGVPQQDGDPTLKPWVSMGEALSRPEPFTVISNYGTGGDPRNRGRRTSSEPAATVTGKISRFRIVDGAGNEQPRFTHAEAGRLQGFPADWPWSGNDIAQQIGNACPVLLGVALLEAATAEPSRAGQARPSAMAA